jgi:aspartyl-tRNA synthetase
MFTTEIARREDIDSELYYLSTYRFESRGTDRPELRNPVEVQKIAAILLKVAGMNSMARINAQSAVYTLIYLPVVNTMSFYV